MTKPKTVRRRAPLVARRAASASASPPVAKKAVGKRTRGERVCAFIERYCRVPEGSKVGQPFLLEDFQRKFIIEVYDNPYVTRNAYLSIAKKNGKTGLVAALLLAHIAGPEARSNTQVVSGAQSRDQASLVFALAEKIIGLSPDLSLVTRIVPSTKRIYGLSKNVEYRALSAEAKNTHGISPWLAILDEVGQVEGPVDPFVTAVITSQGAYENPLLVAISTQAAKPDDLFSTWLDAPDHPKTVKHVYTAPEECELDDRRAWAAANPALGKFKSMSDLEAMATQAMLIPANEADFRNFSLNQRVQKNSPFVSRRVWEENGALPRPLDRCRVWGGLDLASVNDLCALVLVGEDGDIEPHFWLPKVGIAEKSKKERVPYDMWAKDGLLHLTPGRAIEFEHVAEFLRGVFDRCDVQAFGFDRALMRFLKPWLKKAGFTGCDEETAPEGSEFAKFVEFGQGTLSMTPALREMEVRLLSKWFRHGMHPVLTMCAANATTTGDSGARKFEKTKARGRIDGMTALANAVGVMPHAELSPDYAVFFV